MDGEGAGEVEGAGTKFGSVVSPLRNVFDGGVVNFWLNYYLQRKRTHIIS